MNTRMRQAQLQTLIETSWLRPLTSQEQARLAELLAAEPSLRELWAEEAALNRLFERLPAAPVSSNFTARVLNAVPSAKPDPDRAPLFWIPTGWLPRLALVVAMFGTSFLTFHQYQTVHRARMVSRAVEVMPPVVWLQDFDTINRLNKVKAADDDLLTALE